MNYGVNGKLVAKEGEGKTLLAYLLRAAKELDKVDNCFCYSVGTNEDEPEAVYVYEVWADAKAHKDSLTLPAVQKLIADARPIIADMVSYPNLDIHGGKGIE